MIDHSAAKECKHVLVVDDDESIREGIKQILEMEYYEVQLVEDGQAALDYLLSLEDENLPGLIILDLRMPRMDGVSFIKKLSSDHTHLLKIPIVIASANLDYAKAHPFIDAVAKLKKPIDIDEIIKAAQDHCGTPARG